MRQLILISVEMEALISEVVLDHETEDRSASLSQQIIASVRGIFGQYDPEKQTALTDNIDAQLPACLGIDRRIGYQVAVLNTLDTLCVTAQLLSGRTLQASINDRLSTALMNERRTGLGHTLRLDPMHMAVISAQDCTHLLLYYYSLYYSNAPYVALTYKEGSSLPTVNTSEVGLNSMTTIAPSRFGVDVSLELPNVYDAVALSYLREGSRYELFRIDGKDVKPNTNVAFRLNGRDSEIIIPFEVSEKDILMHLLDLEVMFEKEDHVDHHITRYTSYWSSFVRGKKN